MRPSDRVVALGLAVAGALAYLAFGFGTESVYDHYGRLADAFVHGRWWLTDAPAWLNELLACGVGRWCVASPPLPAVLAIPFLPLGTALAQSVASRIAGGLSAGPLYLGLRSLGAPRPVALAGVAVSALGTTLLFTSVEGRSPYAAHAVAMLFSATAFALAARGGPAWGIGAAIGLAALARLPFAAATPALALLAARQSGTPFAKALAGVIAGGVPFALVYVGYDLARWGSVLDLGYGRLTEGDVFYAHGLFSPLYLLRHLRAILFLPPDVVEGTPWFIRFRYEGMGLFFTTPVFLWVFAGLREVRRSAAVGATALAAGLALLPNVLWGSAGEPQFGYRFSIDAQPFLLALAISGDPRAAGGWRSRPSILFLVAAAVSLVMNAYAAIAIVRFGYWQ